jgi:hypothetical protein
MKNFLFALAFALGVLSPIAAVAQAGPGPGPADRQAPPPEVRAKLERIRSDAKTAAFAALSADHRTAVQGIVDSVTAGTVDARAAARKIDDVLSSDEKSAVGAVAQKSRADMRAAFAAAGMTPPGPPPNAGPPPNGGPAIGGAPPNAGPPGGAGAPGGRRGPSAGRFLLGLSLTPAQLRAARPKPTN